MLKVSQNNGFQSMLKIQKMTTVTTVQGSNRLTVETLKPEILQKKHEIFNLKL